MPEVRASVKGTPSRSDAPSPTRAPGETSPQERVLRFPGRYFRMYPAEAPLGHVTEELSWQVDETALLAVDVYGDPTRPDVWNGMVSEASRLQVVDIYERIAAVLAAARAAGMSVVYATNSAPRVALRSSAYGALKQRTLAVDQDVLYARPQDDGSEYANGRSPVLSYQSAVAPAPGDYVVKKHVHSAFFDTRLDTLLRNLGIKNLLCLGFTLDSCLGTTMIDALWRNYNVALVRDCTYAVELPGIDKPGAWTERWLTYVECMIGVTLATATALQSLSAARTAPTGEEGTNEDA